MPEYLAPGVYIEESGFKERSIEGLPTNITAFIGETARGSDHPRQASRITSYLQFERQFGGASVPGRYLPFAVEGFFRNGGSACYVFRICGSGAAVAEQVIGGFRIAAIGPGDWGNRLWIGFGPDTVRDGSTGFQLRAYLWDDIPAGWSPSDPVGRPQQSPPPSVAEEFRGLSLDPMNADYWERALWPSQLVEMTMAKGASMPKAASWSALTGGHDGDPPTAADFAGRTTADSAQRGLAALGQRKFDEVALVCVPGAANDVVSEVVAHCAAHQYRFAVIDGPREVSDASRLDPRRHVDSPYAAFYYPWLLVNDPAGGPPVAVPPCGHICGIYARSDIDSGVWKAPANEPVTGVLGLSADVDDSLQAILNPRGVNVIRSFRGQDIRVWGARTLSSDPEWKYVNVRRLISFLESSMYAATQWVVFEPNDEALWMRIERALADFLYLSWKAGALQGATPTEAYYIQVGRETMSSADIRNGRLIAVVGVAPVKPAEFTILRISQQTMEASRQP